MRNLIKEPRRAPIKEQFVYILFLLTTLIINGCTVLTTEPETLTHAIINTDSKIFTFSENHTFSPVRTDQKTLSVRSESFAKHTDFRLNNHVKIEVLYANKLAESCLFYELPKYSDEQIKKAKTFGQFLENPITIKLYLLENFNYQTKTEILKENNSYVLPFYHRVLGCKFPLELSDDVFMVLIHEAYHADFAIQNYWYEHDVEVNEYFATLLSNCDKLGSEFFPSFDFTPTINRMRTAPESLNQSIFKIVMKLIEDTEKVNFEKEDKYLFIDWCAKQNLLRLEN